MVDVAITGVGLATARGGASELAGAAAPSAIPWPLRPQAASRLYRPARGVAEGPGPARVAALIERALAACSGDAPIVVGTCNGTAASWRDEDWRTSFELARLLAGTPWSGRVQAVASGACASGIQALYLARCLLAAGAPEVIALAVDIATAPAHDNFEGLRLLADAPAPFQPEATGFMLGEAAVALRLARADSGLAAGRAARLAGPVLGYDLDGDDGIARCLAALGARADLVIGQGAGPVAGDRAELAAIAAHVPADVPLTTALHGFGHTLGASSLLSVALAALATGARAPGAGEPAASHGALAPLALPTATVDGRPLGARPAREAIAVCRALGGACGACAVTAGASGPAPAEARLAPAEARHAWGPRSAIPPLHDPVLRRIAAAAAAARPAEPVDLLIVTLETPLPPAVRIGGRILPTSVLEMTPGFVPQLVARAWGHRGPALCLVGEDPAPILAACRATHERVFRLAIRGMEDRDVEWDV